MTSNHTRLKPRMARLTARPGSGAATALAAAVAASLSGCSLLPCPPVRLAWYLDDDTRRPAVVLALLNDSQRAVQVDRLAVNPDGHGGAAARFDSIGSLEPGELHLLRLAEQKPAWRQCRLPVSVNYQCGNGRSRTLAVPAVMPNYLHKDWLDQCPPASQEAP